MFRHFRNNCTVECLSIEVLEFVFCERVAVTKSELKYVYQCTEFSFAPTSTACSMDGKFVPYFSIDNAHLMYNAHPKLFTLYFYFSFVITFDLPLIPF